MSGGPINGDRPRSPTGTASGRWSRQIHRAQCCAGDRQDLRGGLPPPYAGLVVITIGLLIQWQTIVIMFTCSILVFVYVRLARREEREVELRFEEA